MDNNPGHVSTSQKIPLNRYNNLTCTSGLAIQALYHLKRSICIKITYRVMHW